MRFADDFNPTEAELREWAAEEDTVAPEGDWELVLAWGMDQGRLRVCIELAASPGLPGARFFLMVLYTWVSHVARRVKSETWYRTFDRWLDEAKGVRDPAVKRWRRRARMIFQGVEPFDYETWWARLARSLKCPNAWHVVARRIGRAPHAHPGPQRHCARGVVGGPGGHGTRRELGRRASGGGGGGARQREFVFGHGGRAFDGLD
jgi:hypothetical protein